MNDRVTSTKRQAISAICNMLTRRIVRCEFANRVLIADLTAGDGCFDWDSTARTMAACATSVRRRGKSTQLVLSDKHHGRVGDLVSLSGELETDPAIFAKDYCNMVEILCGGGFDSGIILLDPYGPIHNLDRIAKATANMPYVDLVFSIGSTGCKRSRHKMKGSMPADIRGKVQKPRWWLTPSWSKWGWVIMLGTRLQRIQEAHKINLYPVDSCVGQAICAKIDHTERDRKKLGIVSTMAEMQFQHALSF